MENFWHFLMIEQTSTKFSRKTCPNGIFLRGNPTVTSLITWKTWVRTVDSGEFFCKDPGEKKFWPVTSNTRLYQKSQVIYSWSLDDEDFAKQILTTSMFDRVPGLEKGLITAFYLWERATGPRDDKSTKITRFSLQYRWWSTDTEIPKIHLDHRSIAVYFCELQVWWFFLASNT